MSQVKNGLQKAIVRVIASELDRRSRPLERAINDTNARISELVATQEILSAQIEAANDYVRRVHEHVENVEVAHNRLVATTATLRETGEATEIKSSETHRDLHTLLGEFTGLREAVARIDALVEAKTAR